LRQAYRDPAMARQRVEALETAAGGPEGFRRAFSQTGAATLGELRGKAGWLASAGSKAAREMAERSAAALPGGLVQLREAEARAGAGYVQAVEAQRVRDAVAVPGLSPAAWMAVRRVEAAIAQAEGGKDAGIWKRLIARQDGQVGRAWAREVLAQPEVAAELRAFQEAATRRLGEDGVRAAAGEVGRGQGATAPQEGLAGVARVLAMLGDGHGAHAGLQQREQQAEQQRLGLRLGPRLGR
jgi:hypothetical protein